MEFGGFDGRFTPDDLKKALADAPLATQKPAEEPTTESEDGMMVIANTAALPQLLAMMMMATAAGGKAEIGRVAECTLCGHLIKNPTKELMDAHEREVHGK